MRKLLFSLLFSVGCIIAYSQGTSQDSVWIRDNYYKIERMIPMRDGVKLFTSIYIPKDTTEKHPILMTRTAYSCAPYGTDKWKNFMAGYLRYYLREGYIMVTQDVRGRWMSEGQFVDVRPFIKDKKSNTDVDEASDTYDAIDWMVKNLPHNSGKVGVFGISYPGFYSTMAAASAHPALKAVSPQAPVTDWFMGDDFHHNGAFYVMDGWDFYSSFGKPRPKPTTVGPSGFDFYTKDNYKWYLETGAMKNIMKLTGDSIAFWKDLYQHPNRDAWWQARNARVAMYNVKPVMLVVGGLYDAEDCFGAWNLYKAIRAQSPSTNSHLVMGPWYHGEWASNDGTHLGNVQWGSNTSFWYQSNIEIPFFNYYLKGKGSEPKLPAATVFFSGANEWHQFDQWPPRASQERSIFLQADGTLAWQASADKNSFSEYISDPAHPVPYTEDVHFHRTREYMTDDQRFAARRTDVLTFQTPKPFTPSKVETVKFAVPDVAHTFKKGHRLMIQIQSSWFPLVDRNPQKFVDIYTANDSDFTKETIRVFHDADRSSRIILPV